MEHHTQRRAKIVATLGPASSERSVIAELLAAGMDVVRLNLSHGDHTTHRRLLADLRAEAKAQGRFVPVIADLMGPRYRLGQVVGGPRTLEPGERVSLGAEGDAVDLPLTSPELLEHLRPGERVLIDNGLVELTVEGKTDHRLFARVIHGGAVSTRKGINLPDTDLPFDISEKDRADIAFAVAEKIDYIAASYVAGARDLAALRAVAREHGECPPLVAKIERAAAVERMDELVATADALMVARGDLGVEVPLDQVPILQKRIIAAGRRRGVPVIVATQMLESMMERPRPTRAEATDIANAVLEGADALMLSGESAAGRFPVDAVATMARIIAATETYRKEVPEAVTSGITPGPGPGTSVAASTPEDPRHQIADVVCASAAHAVSRLGVGLIVAFSQGGFTARSIARYRPSVPILVFTTDPGVARQVQLVWGVRPMLMDREVERLTEVVEVVDWLLREARLAEPGESVVLLMGYPIRDRPLTNLMRIYRLAEGA